tara:strand:- start:63 stop:245 length:183 start_codon:yes stop_codon:yes gene_type:complete
MTLNLVKGDFNSLEEALRAQVKMMQERNEKLERQIHVLTHERDEWRSKYEHALAINVIKE